MPLIGILYWLAGVIAVLYTVDLIRWLLEKLARLF